MAGNGNGIRENIMRYGWIYSHPLLYRLFCKLRYGRHLSGRYQSLCKIVEMDSSFLDLCAGDSLLFEKLRKTNVSYSAIEINPLLAERLKTKDVNVIIGDVMEVSFPLSDYVYMGASLYQFYNNESLIIKKMQSAARKRVFIIEPVNLFVANSKGKLSWLAESATKVNGKVFHYRYDYNTLQKRMEDIEGFDSIYRIAYDNDCMIIFNPISNEHINVKTT